MEVRGKYEGTAEGWWAVYVAELVDGEDVLDRLEYRVTKRRVCTPNGYTKNPAGARRASRDYWGIYSSDE